MIKMPGIEKEREKIVFLKSGIELPSTIPLRKENGSYSKVAIKENIVASININGELKDNVSKLHIEPSGIFRVFSASSKNSITWLYADERNKTIISEQFMTYVPLSRAYLPELDGTQKVVNCYLMDDTYRKKKELHVVEQSLNAEKVHYKLRALDGTLQMEFSNGKTLVYSYIGSLVLHTKNADGFYFFDPMEESNFGIDALASVKLRVR